MHHRWRRRPSRDRKLSSCIASAAMIQVLLLGCCVGFSNSLFSQCVTTGRSVVFTTWNQYIMQQLIPFEDSTNEHIVTAVFFDYDNCKDLVEQAGVNYEIKNNVFRTHWMPSLKTDVSIAVQLSYARERVNFLQDMIRNWPGPMSTAVLVVREYVEGAKQYFANVLLRNRVNILVHFVVPNPRTFYPYNRLRNIATKAVRTRHHIIVLDVDFCNFSHDFYAKAKRWAAEFNGDDEALVVPVFQPTRHVNPTTWPVTKPELVQSMASGKFQQFKKHLKSPWRTDYDKWFKMQHPYAIQPIGSCEPFIIVKQGSPLYDERFSSAIAHDRSTFTMILAANGYRFSVLPNVFAFHSNHVENPELGIVARTVIVDCTIEMVERFCAELLQKSPHMKEQIMPLCDVREHLPERLKRMASDKEVVNRVEL